MKINLFMVGPAGSGKSSVTGAFYQWLKENTDYEVKIVNLDPGAEYIPYSPDFDIRSLFTTRKIMIGEKLGPNAAMIEASNRMVKEREFIVDKISSLDAEIIIVDTPGQMEAFIFHESGPKLVSLMSNSIAIFILDASIIHRVNELTIGLLLSVITQLKLDVPTLSIINKSDLMTEKDREKLMELMQDPLKIREAIENTARRYSSGAIVDVLLSIADFLPTVLPALRPVLVSAKTLEGFDMLLDLIHETYCTCGDLT